MILSDFYENRENIASNFGATQRNYLYGKALQHLGSQAKISKIMQAVNFR